jgi:hypothetical protein
MVLLHQWLKSLRVICAPSAELALWYIQSHKYTAKTKGRSRQAIENTGRKVFKKSLDTF